MGHDRSNIILKHKSSMLKILFGIFASLLILGAAISFGTITNGWVATTSVVIPSMLLEVIVGAAASIPLGFDPMLGAIIAALGNLAPVPLLMTSFNVIMEKWSWLSKKLEKAGKLSEKYGKYGVWVLTPLAPFIGVYVGVAIGITLRFRPLLMLTSLSLGVIIAALITTYGGEEIKSFFIP